MLSGSALSVSRAAIWSRSDHKDPMTGSHGQGKDEECSLLNSHDGMMGANGCNREGIMSCLDITLPLDSDFVICQASCG